ncbi:MAG: serine/threonine protein kinase [Polyangiaceae bacterium]|nr:serine/threonine protein kinase [Polyangiaceae bacterium]
MRVKLTMAQQQRYRVIERIASGGMAEVFRAESAGLEGFKKTVAIKRVLPHLSEKKQFIGMFLDEARLCSHLSHSNCVQVFDVGVGDNTYFIVMEYVDGADLKSVIEFCRKRSSTVPIEEAILICVRICEGLAYAHELKDQKGRDLHIVHRDMSPPNVLITRFGEVKIVDFGLAKANSQLEKSDPGVIKGKFSYLSPEAALGQEIDARTDIFAVGIILWEMLAGRRLFMGETDLDTVRQVQAARVPSVRQFNPDVTDELEGVLMRGLAGDPAKRYRTARDFGRDLNNVLFNAGRPVSSFDIAKLVNAAMAERAAKKATEPDKASIIGSLIDEALFQFSSLGDDDDSTSVAAPAPAPALGDGKFENVQDWGFDLEPGAGGGGVDRSPSDKFEVGNLAALEDDEPAAPSSASRAPAPQRAPSPAPAAPAAPRAAAPTPEASAAPAPSGAGNGALIAILVVVVLAGGAAGAYFGGLFP